MSDQVQRWIDNAQNGIRMGKPGWVLKSANELKALGDLTAAERVLRHALDARPFFDDVDLATQGKLLTALCALVKERDPADALKIIGRARLKDDGLLIIEAAALGRLDRHDEAIALLESEIEKRPELAEKVDVANKLAGLYMQKGRDADAAKFLGPLVEGGTLEDHLPLRQKLASAYLKTRRPDRVAPLVDGCEDEVSVGLRRRAREQLGGRAPRPAPVVKSRVFVVYGHDPAYKDVELLLHRLGLEPLIFETLPKGGGLTVIEILEEHIRSADAVIALLTPDDEGRKRGAEQWELRARQNVLVESGFAVISRRERSLLVALGGVSIPSDFDGIHRVQAPSWSAAVASEITRRLAEMGLRVYGPASN